MPDIAMCQNKECPKASKCWRAQVTPDPYWQTYSLFKPEKDGTCEAYWAIEQEEDGEVLNNNRSEE